MVSTTAYRAIQEALSNAAKHAAGAPIGIQVRIRPDRLVAVVQNGPPRRPRTDERGLRLGWGWITCARSSLVDGTLAAGADGTGAGAWRWRFRFPDDGGMT